MLENRKKIVVDILVVMFLIGICTVIYGGFVGDAIVIVCGVVILLGCLFYMWVINKRCWIK